MSTTVTPERFVEIDAEITAAIDKVIGSYRMPDSDTALFMRQVAKDAYRQGRIDGMELARDIYNGKRR